MYLRYYTREDEKAVREFMDKIIIEEFKLYKWKEYLENKNYNIFLEKNNKLKLLVDEENRIIGTIGFIDNENKSVELQNFYIIKELRGKGYGKLLYEEFLKEVNKQCINEIFLYTHKEFEVACEFYKKLGYIFESKNSKEEMKFYKAI